MNATSSQLDVLVDQLESRGNLPLIQAWTATEPRQWSYRYIGQQVHSLARRLRRQIASGETVVLLGIDHPEWIIAALAILRAGAVVTPIDVQIANDTLRHVLNDSGARWIFTTSAHQENAYALLRRRHSSYC